MNVNTPVFSNSTTSIDDFVDIDTKFADILTRALEEREINEDEAVILFSAEGSELRSLIQVADELRRRAVGQIITYVSVRNINFTNVCYTGCRFCAFARRLDDPEAQWYHCLKWPTEQWKLGKLVQLKYACRVAFILICHQITIAIL